MAKEEAEDSGEICQISPAKVKKFAQDINSYKANMDKSRGEIGQMFKQFEEDGGHKAALKAAMKVQSMETISAQEFIRNFVQYMKDIGVYDQHDLFDQPVLPAVAEAAAQETTIN